ncbi:MAG: DMT family transporter [Alphaproteobacteria bacterium]
MAAALHSHSDRQTGILLMMAATVCLAVMEAVAKHLTDTLPFAYIAWGRYLFHVVATLPFFLLPRTWPLMRTKRPGLHMFRGVMVFVGTMLFFYAIRTMPLPEATALVFATPLFVAAIAAMLLSERLGAIHWVIMGFGFAGVVVIIRPGPGFNDWVALLPVATSICYAFYQIATRIAGMTDHFMTVFFYTAMGGFICSSAMVPFYWAEPTWGEWGWLAVSGTFACFGQYFLVRAFHKAEASIVSPFMYTQIIWTTILSVLIFGGFPDIYSIVGILMIIGSGILMWHRGRGPKPAPAAPIRPSSHD